jgi:two-component system chemotaxis response regulator CheB
VQNHSGLIFSNTPSDENTYNPNINILFHSLVPFAKNIEIMSVILTGIGEDGVNGCNELGLNGSTCLTETEQSAIVDGMPSRARKEVANIQALNMEEITQKIKEFCN